jgi:hypothetical protein
MFSSSKDLYVDKWKHSHQYVSNLKTLQMRDNFLLTFMWPCIMINFLQWNQLDALISQVYSWNETLHVHVSDSFSVHHQEFFTVYTAIVYVIQVCWQLASRIRMELVPSWSCSQAVSKSVWHIPLLYVLWKTDDDWQRNCPKHGEFHSKNKFEKLVHLVGFIIRKI